MLTSDDLDGLRATVAASFNTTCTRRRYAVGTADTFGNPTAGATSDVAYACRFVPAPGNEDTVDRDVQINEGAVLLPYDADVLGGDQLIVSSTTWEVIGPAVGQSWSTHLRVIVRRTAAT